jgi:hypothetical protein
MDSGEMSSQAVSIHCRNSASDGFIVSCWYSGQFPDSSHLPYRQHSRSLNGLLSTTTRNCKWEVMPFGTITVSVLSRVEATVFTFSVTWPLKASQTSILFFRRTLGLLWRTSLSHSTMSSYIIHAFTLNLNIIPGGNFSFWTFILFTITMVWVFFHQPERKASQLFSVFHILLFWQLLIFKVLYQL